MAQAGDPGAQLRSQVEKSIGSDALRDALAAVRRASGDGGGGGAECCSAAELDALAALGGALLEAGLGAGGSPREALLPSTSGGGTDGGSPPRLPPLPATPAMAAARAALGDWRAFDAFELAEASGGAPLRAAGGHVLAQTGALRALGLDAARADAFFAACEAAYGGAPYHCGAHAADVVQALGCLLAALPGGGVPPLEALALVAAAAAHDVGHPGLSNDCLVRCAAPLAALLGPRAPNEAAHAAVAAHLLARSGLLAPLAAADRARVAGLVAGLVLATDMAEHGALAAAFAAALDAHGPSLAAWPAAARPAALRMLLHCADLSNQARPLRAAAAWGERVRAEFFAQGDAERRAGLEPSPGCDRREAAAAGGRGQAEFVERTLAPTFELLGRLLPAFAADVRPLIDAALAHWRAQTAPGQALA